MPRIPAYIDPKGKRISIASQYAAVLLARFLDHHGEVGGGTRIYSVVARVVRRWFEEDPNAKRAFLAWYEALPEDQEVYDNAALAEGMVRPVRRGRPPRSQAR